MNEYKDLIILPRCDTEQNWNAVNPVLKENEFIIVGIDDTCRKYKLGDGVHRYTELPFHTLKYCLKFGYLYAVMRGREHIKFKTRILFDPKLIDEVRRGL